jgi:enoyl-CoA hydratase
MMTVKVLARHSDFSVELDEYGVAHLILGQPAAMPATGREGHGQLGEIWSTLAGEAAVRCILVRSCGKGFCAGGTPELVEELLREPAARLRVMGEARALVQGMIDCDRPIVSAINGAAVGAGAALALLADISIASRTAKIIDGHTKVGIAAGDHAAVIWPLLCGMAKAKYYLLLCETLSGEEAERIGLVSLCVSPEELDDKALEIARRLATGSPTALGFTKRALNHWLRAAWPAFEHSLSLEFMGFGYQDAREGVAALREKRSPLFSGS